MSGLDRDGLRRIAEAATEGPWRVESRINANVVGNTETIASGSTPIADCWGRPQSWREPDARHIAAFDPPTALALLDTADALLGIRAWLAWAEKRNTDFANLTDLEEHQ